MGYDVSLECECCKRPMKIDPHQAGGCVAIGGTTDAEMSVTYNYSPNFATAIEGGLESLHGLSGGETVVRLEAAVDVLGTERDADYWNNTPGNAGYILSIMLEWAKKFPDAIWRIE